MDKELLKDLYCKWCPWECEGLTLEEKRGCVACGGFVDDLEQADYRLLDEHTAECKKHKTIFGSVGCTCPKPSREAVKRIVQQAYMNGYNAKCRGEVWEQEDGTVKLPDTAILLDTLQILALTPETYPQCGLCGSTMSKNPHIDAGKPDNLLEVGAVYICIPCTVKGMHNWAERAMKAEGELLTPEVLSDEELEAIYKKTYAEALKWSEKYEVGLSAKNWNPNRPADRERWFCTQHTNQIMRAVAQAQLDKGE